MFVGHWLLPLGVAAIAWTAVIGTLDSSGAVPWLGEGPGLTLDETFNVQMGVYHVRMVREYGLALLSVDSIREIFGAEVYNPDHPPLGRILIGLAHELTWPVFKPDVPAGAVAVTCGRAASAYGFAATVLLVGWMTSRWYGLGAGLIAAISLVLMPRLFAHAHIAALETLIGFAYVAAVLQIAERWTKPPRPSWKTAALSGVLFGLALLTKIQAILLPVPIVLWALWHWRLRAIGPLAVFGVVGASVFFVGWPWLWLDPVAHVSEYLGRTTDRLTLYCWYMDHKWADTDVPWHYPLVMFAVTVPIGLHALGVLGLCGLGQCPEESRRTPEEELQISDFRFAIPNLQFAILRQTLTRCAHRDSARQNLLALNVFWPLAFFALPGITVYDGARLFLMVFPLWGVFIGRGGQLLWKRLAVRWNPRRATVAIGLLLALQSYGTIAMHPVQLSYYNLLVGGLRGASRLGFEVTYWGDSVTRSLLREVEPEWADGPVYVAPVLHPFQLQELHTQTPELHVTLTPFDEARAWNVRRLLINRRRADSWRSLTPEPPNSRLRAEVKREGVQLSGFYEIERGTFGEEPPGPLF
ncbi:MAG: ArnT family glycosyltransferase [Planctomycetaceae bacterium]